jgi:hypothetical protein
MTLSIKITKRPKELRLQMTEIRQEVVKQLQPVARQHVSQRAAVVSRWQDSHRPEFEANVSATDKQITLSVRMKNAGKSLGKYGGTIGDLWRWINEGTKAHDIVPRFATILRFAVGGGVAFARRVRHPGTAGQKHNERINERLRRQFEQAIDRGIRQGFKRR